MRLRVKTGTAEINYDIIGGMFLGRARGDSIKVNDKYVSRRHLTFRKYDEETVSVIDLRSANGTYVNGRRIDVKGKLIQVGDIIRVGHTDIEVVN